MRESVYRLRPATEADYQYCYDLTKENMLSLFTRHWGGWKSSAFKEDFCVADTTIVEKASSRIGYFCLKETEVGLHLDNIQLSSSVQNQGIGTAILTNVLESNDATAIELTTFTDNPAMRLYEKLGFETVEQEGGTVRMVRTAATSD